MSDISFVAICIPFLAALLGIAYPIILQVIARLDEKYGSDIVTLFKKENEYEWFILFLKSSLGILLLYIVISIYGFFTHDVYKDLWLFISEIVMVTVSVALIVSFFYIIKKMLLYYTSPELVKYLIKRDKTDRPKGNSEFFIALKGTCIYSIKVQDNILAEAITGYIYESFKKHREDHPNDSDGYPQVLFEMLYSLAEELLITKQNKLKAIEGGIFSGVLLTGEFSENKISEPTYYYMWLIIRMAIVNKRDDLVLRFWHNSFQYYIYCLRIPERQYSSELRTITNKEDIDRRKAERERFHEFHYALGGLLLKEGRHDCIRRILSFTLSEPPDYVLFPHNLAVVYSSYLHFQKYVNAQIHFIYSRYPFPELDGLVADGLIRKWISKYLVVLFLSLYTRHKYYEGQDFLNVPDMPSTLRDRNLWLNYIDHFISLATELLENADDLKSLGFEGYGLLSDGWCDEDLKPRPLDLLSRFKDTIKSSIEDMEITQSPEPSKILEFKEASKQIIKDTFNAYKPVLNKQKVEKEYNYWAGAEVKPVINKAAFCIDQGESYAGYEKVNAEWVSNHFKMAFSNCLFYQKTKTFSLKEPDFFKGIKNLTMSPKDFVIISFGLKHFMGASKIDGLISSESDDNTFSYNNVPIINFNYYNMPLLGQSVFVLRKTDLPYLLIKEPDQEVMKKYNPEAIDEDLKIFGRVIDLRKEPALQKEAVFDESEKDLNKHVLIYLGWNYELRVRKNIEIVQLMLYYEYQQRGLPSSPDEIKPFDSI